MALDEVVEKKFYVHYTFLCLFIVVIIHAIGFLVTILVPSFWYYIIVGTYVLSLLAIIFIPLKLDKYWISIIEQAQKKEEKNKK